MFLMPTNICRINFLPNSFVTASGQLFRSTDRSIFIVIKIFTMINWVVFQICENLGEGNCFLKWLKEEGKKETTGPKLSSFLWRIKQKEEFVFFCNFSSTKCPLTLKTKFQSSSLKKKKKNQWIFYQKAYSHIFPSFYISHNLAASYASCGFYEVSWGDPVHNNNFQYHLK